MLRAMVMPETDQYPLLDWMQENGIPVTRENYIVLDYLGELPKDWTPEHEEELPEQLQDWDRFELTDDGNLVEQHA